MREEIWQMPDTCETTTGINVIPIKHIHHHVIMQPRTKLSLLEHLHGRDLNVVRCHPKYQNESVWGNRNDTPLSYAWCVVIQYR